jgi:hypothetical protein
LLFYVELNFFAYFYCFCLWQNLTFHLLCWNSSTFFYNVEPILLKTDQQVIWSALNQSNRYYSHSSKHSVNPCEEKASRLAHEFLDLLVDVFFSLFHFIRKSFNGCRCKVVFYSCVLQCCSCLLTSICHFIFLWINFLIVYLKPFCLTF